MPPTSNKSICEKLFSHQFDLISLGLHRIVRCWKVNRLHGKWIMAHDYRIRRDLSHTAYSYSYNASYYGYCRFQSITQAGVFTGS